MSVRGTRWLVGSLIGVAAVLVAVLLIAALPGVGGGDQTAADPYRPSLDEAQDDLGQDVPEDCRVVGKESEPRVCVFGKEDGRRVLLFGDSHALQWSPALVPLAKERGWRLMTLLRAGCPIAEVPTRPHCAEWRRRALDKIPELKPEYIVVSTSIGGRYRIKYDGQDLTREESEPQLREGMTKTLERLKEIPSVLPDGKGIILIRDQIKAPFVPAECIKENRDNPEACGFPKKRRWPPGFDVVAAQRTGIARIVDPVLELCGPEWCSPLEGNILKYRDSDHISATYAQTFSRWFGDRLGIP